MLFLLEMLPIMYVIYVLITYVSNWQVRSRWFLVLPAYSLAQTLVMPPLGFLRYLRISTRVFGGTGRYQFSAAPDWMAPRRDFSRVFAVLALTACWILTLRIAV